LGALVETQLYVVIHKEKTLFYWLKIKVNKMKIFRFFYQKNNERVFLAYITLSFLHQSPGNDKN
jgi:hypothetical protein